MEAMDLACMKIGEKICIFKKSKQNQSILSSFFNNVKCSCTRMRLCQKLKILLVTIKPQ